MDAPVVQSRRLAQVAGREWSLRVCVWLMQCKCGRMDHERNGAASGDISSVREQRASAICKPRVRASRRIPADAAMALGKRRDRGSEANTVAVATDCERAAGVRLHDERHCREGSVGGVTIAKRAEQCPALHALF